MNTPILTDEQIKTFQQNGFVKGGRVLSDDEVEELREELDRVVRERDDESIKQPVRTSVWGEQSGKPVWQIVNIWEASEAFDRLVRHKPLADAVSKLMDGNELRIWHDQIQIKPAENGGVNSWHQDSPYWGTVHPTDRQVSAWVAFDEVAEDNGCMRMVCGSHKWGDRVEFLHTLKSLDDMPDEHDGHPLEVRLCPVGKGEVHFHHSLTWHGSHENTSCRPRRALAIHYMTESHVFKAEGGHLMKEFIHVGDRETIKGDHFPLVWKRA
jgi:phytanoyl-CoA hydroxylase